MCCYDCSDLVTNESIKCQTSVKLIDSSCTPEGELLTLMWKMPRETAVCRSVVSQKSSERKYKLINIASHIYASKVLQHGKN